MEARIEVEVEHLGGPSKAIITTTLEPNVEAWNERTFSVMAQACNRLLGAIFDERERLAFEEEQAVLGRDNDGEGRHDAT